MLLLVGCMPQCAYGGQGQLSRSLFCTSAVVSRLRGLELACTLSSLPLWVQYIGFTFFVLFHLIVCVHACARVLRLSCGNQYNLFLSFHHMCFMYYTQAITVGNKCLPSNPFWPQCVAFYRCVCLLTCTYECRCCGGQKEGVGSLELALPVVAYGVLPACVSVHHFHAVP